MMDLDILAFSPHPDDAELGCAGSLILATDRGLRVAIADLSAGEMASRGSPAVREAERGIAAAELGLCARFQVGLPDCQLGAEASQRLPIIQLIRETRPRIVLSPYKEDRHPDHVAASRLVGEACFLAGVSKIGAGRPHRPEQVCHYMIHHPFTPSLVVDISAVWDRKMASIRAYKSQFETSDGGSQTAISGTSFLRFIEAQAIVFGAMIGASHGEAFVLPGPVPMRELPGLTNARLASDELPLYRAF